MLNTPVSHRVHESVQVKGQSRIKNKRYRPLQDVSDDASCNMCLRICYSNVDLNVW